MTPRATQVFDDRNMREPCATMDLGGGVWRVKWHPAHANMVSIAAMRGGAHVLSWEGSELSKLSRFDGHLQHAEAIEKDSLVYGIDWLQDTEDRWTFASCAFYDRSVCVWSTSAAAPDST